MTSSKKILRHLDLWDVPGSDWKKGLLECYRLDSWHHPDNFSSFLISLRNSDEITYKAQDKFAKYILREFDITVAQGDSKEIRMPLDIGTVRFDALISHVGMPFPAVCLNQFL